MTTNQQIAVIGMAARMPGSTGIPGFWADLRAGREGLTRFTTEQSLAAGVDPALSRHPDYIPVRGTIDGGDRFDHSFFGYSPAEAATIDPQQRVFLEVASTALDDAGIDPARLNGWIGVYAGSDITPDRTPGEGELLSQVIGAEKDFVATRVAYKLGLRGPALAVQTACSTSLVAVHQACNALLSHDCDVALAGGVSLRLPQWTGYQYSEGHIMSRDGHCRPFDADGSGTVPSSGAGVVALRRLEDALASGDRVLAVIRGWALNNDGGSKVGYTAPSVTGQRDVIRLALARAGADPADIGCVEAHGTATKIGDPIEMAALTSAFRDSTDHVGTTWLGAVKSNIGHTGAAAGVAGLIKTVLQLHHREIAPTVHYRSPNPALNLAESPFRIATEVQPWDTEGPLLAGVSSFGIGGTNAHVVLESAPRLTRTAQTARPRVFPLSAHSPWALEKLRTSVADALTAPALGSTSASASASDDGTADRLGDVAFTLAEGRRRLPYRTAVVAGDRESLAAALRAPADPVEHRGATPAVAFVFPGHGTLHQGAGAAAHRLLPEFRRVFDEAALIVRERYGLDLSALVTGRDAPVEEITFQQLALFTLGYALGRQLRVWGVRPASMMGNSVGEYVVAALAGVWNLEDALSLVHLRGRGMLSAAPGRMVAVVRRPGRELGIPDGVTLAIDAPHQLVLSGEAEPVMKAHRTWEAEGWSCRILEIDRASHSPMMDAPAAELRAVAATTPTGGTDLGDTVVVSTLTGEAVEPGQLTDPGHWGDHLRGTVQLRRAIGTLLDAPHDLVVELGPGQSTLRGLRMHPDWNTATPAIPALGRSADQETESVLELCATLWEHGVAVDLAGLLDADEPSITELPAHPYEPKPLPARPTTAAAAAPEAPGHPEPAALAAPETHPTLTTDAWTSISRRLSAHSAAAVGERLAAELGLPATDDRFTGLTASVVVAELPDDDDRAAPSALADRARTAGVQLLLLGREVFDVLDDSIEAAALPSPAAEWLGHRETAGDRTTLLDIGPAGRPDWLPAPWPGATRYAWRGSGWWALLPRPVPVEPVTDAPRVALVTDDPDATVLAADLAAAGVHVASLTGDGPPPARPTAGTIAATQTWRAGSARLSQRPELNTRVDRYSAGLIARFALERAGLRPGDRIAASELRHRLNPGERLTRFFDFLLRSLVEEDVLRPGQVDGADGYLVAAGPQDLLAAGAGLGEVDGLHRLLDSIAAELSAVFDGEKEPVAVLWPDGDDSMLRSWLPDNRLEIYDGGFCLDALEETVRSLHRTWGDRPLRILEVGGGHGLFTWQLLEGWQDRDNVDYHFTDISTLLVRRAAKYARTNGVRGVRFSTYDMTRDPVEQGLAAGSFDLVIAYNVIHVAPSVHTALGHLRSLLSPSGAVSLVEVTDVTRWSHLLWGLAPGWWDFDDELRSDSIVLDAATWRRALAESGLPEITVVPDGVPSDHTLMIAAPSRAADGVPAAPPSPDVDLVLSVLRSPDERTAHEATARWKSVRSEGPLAATPGVLLSTGPLDGATRALLDSPADADWTHLHADRFGAAVLDALPEVLGQPWLPRTVRLRAPEIPDTVPASAAPAPMAPADVPETLRPAAAPAPAGPDTRLEQGPPAPPAAPAAAPVAEPVAPVPAVAGPSGALAALDELWRYELGVPRSRAEDDFFALGGESLAAVHLLARVRDVCGIKVPMSDFTRDPTYGFLAGLVGSVPQPRQQAQSEPQPQPQQHTQHQHQQHAQPQPQQQAQAQAQAQQQSQRRAGTRTPADSPNLMTLNDAGEGTPLFLSAPAAGSALCYRGLAKHLGDRPLYGLETPGLHDGRAPLSRLEDIANHHVELIRSIQPDGPYLLGGWSFGMMLSHEIARQIIADGGAVALLSGVDGYLPNTGGMPMVTQPGFLLGGLVYKTQAVLGLGGAQPAGANGPEPDDRILRIADVTRWRRQRARAGRQEKTAADFVSVHNHSIDAMFRYVPQPVNCPAVILKAGLNERGRLRLERGLRGLYTAVEVRSVAGDHWTVMDRRNAPGLATQLNQALRQHDPLTQEENH
ncbi:beta-ketoacyl synthase N-terminal-like domain-containing protein [Streptomyces sp. JV176]|uniref:type I polyketide synthase n=1 Tax=Streptomyces sp. JV176 TaxID=858630 RepID=UPI002E78F952|nr:polyketide synthase [Streptomyces sp. JV176]MEE1800981.1 beta-ketoacyl synthase N-terminal-like domain-containing protein [Streptomyces sp. JV176]